MLENVLQPWGIGLRKLIRALMSLHHCSFIQLITAVLSFTPSGGRYTPRRDIAAPPPRRNLLLLLLLSFRRHRDCLHSLPEGCQSFVDHLDH